jgi:hypothetical protein
MKAIEFLASSLISQILLTLAAYSFYAVLIGASLTPSVYLAAYAYSRFLAPAINASALPGMGDVLLFSLSLACSFFLFFFFGLLLMGLVMRIVSLGIRPGKYRGPSFPALLWAFEGGLFTLVCRLILGYVPMTFFSQMFYWIVGCRIGRNVRINTIEINDPYLVSIGDNSVLGGGAVIAPHAYEGGCLILERVEIGKDCLIGAEAYISPGVVVGDGSLVGLRTHVRRGTRLPPGSRVLSPAGMPPDRVYELERGRVSSRRSKRASRQ